MLDCLFIGQTNIFEISENLGFCIIKILHYLIMQSMVIENKYFWHKTKSWHKIKPY